MSEDRVINDLVPQKFSLRGKIWVVILLLLCCLGLFAYYKQVTEGLGVTAMRDYASWGIYISNFVFFVAISLVGSLITAVLRLTNAEWSTPLTRIAEIIAVSAILFAAIIIVIDMGRPDRMFNLFIYGRLQSPIMWDVIVITTYLFISLLLLFYPLLPDLKILSNNNAFTEKRKKLYKFLSLNWAGSKEQFSLSNKAIKILSIMIIPIALSIHTVTAWLFATTYRPGWDSTNFGPYFVSGAFMAGAGAVIVAMYVFRKNYNLEKYITDKHFDHMGKLLVLLSCLYMYFTVNEYLVPAYKMKSAETEHLNGLFVGEFAVMFWSVIILGMVVPILVLIFKKGRKPLPMFIMGVLVVVGAWFKRYIIVTPTLLHPFLPKYGVPENYMHYFPTWEEWAITAGSLAGTLLLITIFARYFPIIPIHETIEEDNLKTT
jgi:Ni/Fe-hydrogenase subunit HybB-like protein